jgi:hypothetical protein
VAEILPEALATALDKLDGGHIVVIFPDGPTVAWLRRRYVIPAAARSPDRREREEYLIGVARIMRRHV